MNLLTAARLYVDQVSQHVQGITGKAEKSSEVKKLFSREYDNSLEYRFMDALRNHVQHRGLPVHITQFNCSAMDTDQKRKLRFSIKILLEKLKLSQDKTFKQTVLKKLPEIINLKMYSRGYIESLSKIHVEVRNLVGSKLEVARKKLKNAISSYKSGL